jgi:flagellar hook-length control protein FliK
MQLLQSIINCLNQNAGAVTGLWSKNRLPVEKNNLQFDQLPQIIFQPGLDKYLDNKIDEIFFKKEVSVEQLLFIANNEADDNLILSETRGNESCLFPVKKYVNNTCSTNEVINVMLNWLYIKQAFQGNKFEQDIGRESSGGMLAEKSSTNVLDSATIPQANQVFIAAETAGGLEIKAPLDENSYLPANQAMVIHNPPNNDRLSNNQLSNNPPNDNPLINNPSNNNTSNQTTGQNNQVNTEAPIQTNLQQINEVSCPDSGNGEGTVQQLKSGALIIDLKPEAHAGKTITGQVTIKTSATAATPQANQVSIAAGKAGGLEIKAPLKENNYPPANQATVIHNPPSSNRLSNNQLDSNPPNGNPLINNTNNNQSNQTIRHNNQVSSGALIQTKLQQIDKGAGPESGTGESTVQQLKSSALIIDLKPEANAGKTITGQAYNNVSQKLTNNPLNHSTEQYIKDNNGAPLQNSFQQIKGFETTKGVRDQFNAVQSLTNITANTVNFSSVEGPTASRTVENPVFMQIAQTIRNHVIKDGQGQTHVKIQLQPKYLGEVVIKLTYRDGNISTHFQTATEQAKYMIEQSIGQLREVLTGFQLNLQNVSVSVGGENSRWGQDWNQNRSFKKQQRGIKTEGIDLNDKAVNGPINGKLLNGSMDNLNYLV